MSRQSGSRICAPTTEAPFTAAGTIGGMHETESKTSIGARVLALLVLAVAAWVLFKIVIGTVVAIAWTAAAIVAVVAVIWAINKLA